MQGLIGIGCILLSLTLGGCSAASAAGHVRTFYIAADQVVWDYAPMHRNNAAGRPYDKLERVYAVNDGHHIGNKYHKVLYRQYTDGTFKHLQMRSAGDQYLGLLGPIIHAEVGDTIRVVFRNNASRPYSIHPHGVFYAKPSEAIATTTARALSAK